MLVLGARTLRAASRLFSTLVHGRNTRVYPNRQNLNRLPLMFRLAVPPVPSATRGDRWFGKKLPNLRYHARWTVEGLHELGPLLRVQNKTCPFRKRPLGFLARTLENEIARTLSLPRRRNLDYLQLLKCSSQIESDSARR